MGKKSRAGQSVEEEVVVDYDLVDSVAKNMSKTRLQIGSSLEEGLKLDRDAYQAGQTFALDFTTLLRQQEWGMDLGFDKMEMAVLGMIQSATQSTPRESFVQGLHSFFAMCFFHKITNLVKLGEVEKASREEKGVRWADRC